MNHLTTESTGDDTRCGSTVGRGRGTQMTQMPATGAVADYRAARYRILFRNSDGFPLRADLDEVIPDAFDRGERQLAATGTEPWAKVQVYVIVGIVEVRVTGAIHREMWAG